MTKWGNENSLYKMSEIVLKAVECGKGCFFDKENVHLDMSFNDAVERAYIKLGLSSDEAQPYFHDLGSSFQIEW